MHVEEMLRHQKGALQLAQKVLHPLQEVAPHRQKVHRPLQEVVLHRQRVRRPLQEVVLHRQKVRRPLQEVVLHHQKVPHLLQEGQGVCLFFFCWFVSFFPNSVRQWVMGSSAKINSSVLRFSSRVRFWKVPCGSQVRFRKVPMRFRCGFRVRFQMVPMRCPNQVPEGSGAGAGQPKARGDFAAGPWRQ